MRLFPAHFTVLKINFQDGNLSSNFPTNYRSPVVPAQAPAQSLPLRAIPVRPAIMTKARETPPTPKSRTQKRDATEALGDDAAGIQAKMPAITAQPQLTTGSEPSERGMLPPP